MATVWPVIGQWLVEFRQVISFKQFAAINDDSPPKREVLKKVQYLILITCRDEEHQVELLGRFAADGHACKAHLS